MTQDTDAVIAAAYEAAAILPTTSEWRWRFEPHWSAADMATTIRALTPAHALAALDARINAAREEGLRLAAKICTRGDDRAAILAKIEEADHE